MVELRKPCIGKCGRLVMVKLGAECRKCRRRRKHAGLKRIMKLQKAKKAEGRGSGYG
jgi:hypothetical protein